MKNINKKISIIIFILNLVFTEIVFAASTVTVDSVSSITQTSATLNATLTDVGNHTPTTRGFQWGTDSNYGTTTSDTDFYEKATFAGVTDLANQLVVDSSGNMYLPSNSLRRFRKYNSSGTMLLNIAVGAGSYPTGAALDSSGNMYTFSQSSSAVKKYNSSGVFVSEFGSNGTGDGEFDNASYNYIAIDSSDNIYVADTGNDRIQKFDSSGSFVTKWGTNGSGDGQFNFISGLAIDSSNNIYVSDQTNNNVQKFDSSGNFLIKWGSTGTGSGQFTTAAGIGFDTSGNVYVADYSNNRIQKFTSSGTYISQFGSSASQNGPDGLFVDSSNYIYTLTNSATDITKVVDPNTSFSTNLTGLTCGTTYHYRPYITTDAGTTYGSDTTFATSACPSSNSSSTSASARVTNLINMGKIKEAQDIINQFPNATKDIQIEITPEVKLIKSLKKGTNNSIDQVRVIQKALNLIQDGKFGPKTEKAVKDFQKQNNLKVDGIVGPQTWGEINKIN